MGVEEHSALDVHYTVLYHSSLPSAYLLGTYDSKGTYKDGLLLRSIRRAEKELDDTNSLLSNNFATSLPTTLPLPLPPSSPSPLSLPSTLPSSSFSPVPALHVIILDGPCGHFTEQLFCDSLHQLQTHPPLGPLKLSYPSGEIHRLPKNLKFILETSDLRHASPAFLSVIPVINVSVSVESCLQRLVTVWVSSLNDWLGFFPPWRDILKEIRRILIDTRYILYFYIS